MLLLLLLRKFFVCTLGGAGAIRTGFARACVTIVPRDARVLVVFDGIVGAVDTAVNVVWTFVGCEFLSAALSSSVIASCMARSN